MSKDVGDEEMVQENLKSKYNAAFNIAIRYGFCSDCRWAFESKECMACDCYVNAVSLIKQAIVKQIDTDAEQIVRGTWIMRGGKRYCSVCGDRACVTRDTDDFWYTVGTKFCPNCGTKMDTN